MAKVAERHESLFFQVVLLLIFCCAVNAPAFAQNGQQAALPQNIQLDKEDFESIANLAGEYEQRDAKNVQYRKTDSGEQRLRQISFVSFNEPVAIKGSKSFPIPPEIARVLRFFPDLRCCGQVASQLELELITPTGTAIEWTVLPGHFWKTGDGEFTTYTKTSWLETKKSGLLNPRGQSDDVAGPTFEGYQIRVKGTGTLRSIYLWHEAGLEREYDIVAYTVIGADKPWLNVRVDVDALSNLSLNGTNKLDEDVFKRYHINSGPIGLQSANDAIDVVDRAYHAVTTEYGFLPGRGAFHLSYLEDHFGLREDERRPGYTDYASLRKRFTKSPEVARKWDLLFPTVANDFVLTTDAWPMWQKVDPDNETNRHTGAPALDKFDAAAELAGELLAVIDQRFDGRGPRFLEVKNESTISVEWPYMNSDPDRAWEYLADFHNVVAECVKKRFPQTQVGGPSSAFMYLEKDGFAEARKQLEFMDATRGRLDFYSHHFYESGPTLIHEQEQNPGAFLAGRMEAVFSLLANHMTLTDNVRPFYITEGGDYNNGGAFTDYGKKLRAYNGYMIRLMNMADSIGMYVPYLYPIINWKPDSLDSFYKYNSDYTALDGMTPVAHYLDVWQDYRGAFVPVAANNSRVITHAVRQGNKVFVAVQNMNPQRAHVNLAVETGDVSVASCKRKHTFVELGKLVHEEIAVEDLSKIPMRAEEFSVFEITLAAAPEFEKTVSRKSHFGDKLIQATGADPIEFVIQSEDRVPARSVLRICLGKSGRGFKGDMQVRVNGKRHTKSLAHTDQSGDFFGFVDINLAPKMIRSKNKVRISIPEEGGYISNVVLINDYDDKPLEGVATDALKKMIASASRKLGRTESVSAEDDEIVAMGLESLRFAIARAERVANDPIATKAEVKKSMAELRRIGEALFKGNQSEKQ